MTLPFNDEWTYEDWTYCFPDPDDLGPAETEILFRSATVPTEPAARFGIEDIAEVVHFHGVSPEDFASRELYAICRLTDGRWASVYAWADTTGWGCQDGVTWHVGDSYDEVVLWGLDDEGRSMLGLEDHAMDTSAIVDDLRALDHELRSP